jgi:condensin-2 complex subunit H2
MDDHEDDNNRFAHLLQPIRDLSINWNIDIASELEEYLSELESITISFDDGKSLNFAEGCPCCRFFQL